MVGWQEARESLPISTAAAAGGTAGAVTRALCQPLDVLKIRFQLQTEPLRNTRGSKYSGMAQASALIVREEGAAALWSGHVPAQALSVSYGLVQFAAFERLSQACHRAQPELAARYRHAVAFACGAVAACLATVASFPLDTVRTRLIAEERARPVYRGVWHTCLCMARSEGPRSLFKGLFPTLAQIAPHAGIQFVTYKTFSESVFNRISISRGPVEGTASRAEPTWAGNLLAGATAGTLAKVAIYPMDLVKKRLQIQGFQQHRESFGRQFYCRGFTNCVVRVVSEEGLLGLYKGLAPSTAKAMLTTALHFAIYDEVSKFLSAMA